MLKGAFSNNILTLNKQGGGSVDIPLQISPTIPSNTITASATNTYSHLYVSYRYFNGVAPTSNSSGISYDLVEIYQGLDYAGPLSLSNIHIEDQSSSDRGYVFIAKTDSYNFDCSGILNTTISNGKTFGISIEEGYYCMPIDVMMYVYGQTTYSLNRKYGTEIPSSEYIYFNVSGGVATLDSTNVSINMSNFKASHSGQNRVDRIVVILDRIKNVN